MGSSQRALLAVHCGWVVMSLAGCGPWVPKPTDDRAPHPQVTPAQPACTQWDAYDADWHRRHCDDPIRWCSIPGSFDTTNGGNAGTTGSAGSEGSTTGAAGVKGGTGSAGSEGSTTGAAGSAGSAGSEGAAGAGAGGAIAGTDAGAPEADAGASSGSALDGGGASADAGHSTGGQGACVVGTSCPQGSSCVTGSCQTCPGGVCTCQRDDDCAAMQICDHDTATCTSPPPACTALATEAACAARVDCTPFYGGMSCTNNVGSPCHSGEANCTCATYSFAACVARD
jgi:hypothetical protein